MTERSIRAVLMRGGTSKGVFVHLADLPPPGPDRDRVIRALLGSPDPMQIDGLGGTHSSTSKLVAVARSDARPADGGIADVDYLFAQVGVDEPIVDYQGNCGNLTTAVAPFAVDEGIVEAGGSVAAVTLRNLNTGVRVLATVRIVDGRAAVEGDHVVAGVPGTGAPVATAYLDPGGSVLGQVLPTGRAVDRVALDDGSTVDVSIVDVTSPHAFVRAADVGLDLAIGPPAAAHPDLLAGLERIRAAAGRLVGLDSPAVPRLAVVAPPRAGGADLEARATSMGRVHHAFPMTGALCTAAAAHIPGTVVHEAAAGGCDGSVRLRHAKGVVDMTADVAADGPRVVVRSVGVVRTARRLMTGEAHIVEDG